MSGYDNTNTLAELASDYASHLVRTRKDKYDYKFFEDTRHGGLRGNLSTALTLRGYIKYGNGRCTAYYGIGKNDALVNAVIRGDIILDEQKLCAHTNKEQLKQLLENEAAVFTVRENQAHLKTYLLSNPDFPFKRDTENYPKKGVMHYQKRIYCLRLLLNRIANPEVFEYNLLDYWQGTKIRQKNLHAMIIVPRVNSSTNIVESFDNFRMLKSEDLMKSPSLLWQYNAKSRDFIAVDSGHKIPTYSIEDALNSFSLGHENISLRLQYNWEEIRSGFCQHFSNDIKNIKPTESFVFLRDFLRDSPGFIIEGKTVVNWLESASGGPDIILKYAGGTEQKLELEHSWSHFIQHNHHKKVAWKGAWLYANESWDFDKIKQLFLQPYLEGYYVPEVFLFTNEGKKAGMRITWSSKPVAQPITIEDAIS